MKYEEKDFYELSQAYCSNENEHKVMDPILMQEAGRIAKRVANAKLKEWFEHEKSSAIELLIPEENEKWAFALRKQIGFLDMTIKEIEKL